MQATFWFQIVLKFSWLLGSFISLLHFSITPPELMNLAFAFYSFSTYSTTKNKQTPKPPLFSKPVIKTLHQLKRKTFNWCSVFFGQLRYGHIAGSDVHWNKWYLIKVLKAIESKYINGIRSLPVKVDLKRPFDSFNIFPQEGRNKFR